MLKKTISLMAIISLMLTMALFTTACSDSSSVEGVYKRTKKEYSYTQTSTMRLSDGRITRDTTFYDLATDSYSYGNTSYGSYEFDDDMVYGYRNFKRFRNRILHIFSHQKLHNKQAAA